MHNSDNLLPRNMLLLLTRHNHFQLKNNFNKHYTTVYNYSHSGTRYTLTESHSVYILNIVI